MNTSQHANLKLTVNQSLEFDQLSLGQLDAVIKPGGSFHVLEGDHTFHANLIMADYKGKKFTIDVNNTLYEVQIENDQDLLVKELGFNLSREQKVVEVKAPMPGLVLEIAIEKEQELEAGETLLILEAMKMENVIKTDAACKVQSIEVKQGDAVEKGQVLIKFY